MKAIVLGSGPASVFCALSLLKSGAEVLMIEPGEQLESEREKVLSDVSGKKKSDWPTGLFELVKENTEPNVKGLPRKLVYGSDYAFRWLENGVVVRQAGVDTLTSHALGGLSNAWGANIMPLLSADTVDWPVSLHELEHYYRKVSEYLPVSGVSDNLRDLFPLYGDADPLPLSRQAASLLADAEKHREKLKPKGI